MTTKLAIASDSHGNLAYMSQFLEQIENHKPDLVYHLGDNYEDATCIIDKGYSLIRVPGTWSSYYQDYKIDNRRIEEVEGWRLFLTHTPTQDSHDRDDDPDPEEVCLLGKCDVMLHGHTHRPEVVHLSDLPHPVIRINPGHLKAATDRGYHPSYALIDLTIESLHVKLIDLLSTNVIVDQQFRKGS